MEKLALLERQLFGGEPDAALKNVNLVGDTLTNS
jgi:hypothetical protein